MKTLIRNVLIVWLLLMAVGLVFAQDETPTVEQPLITVTPDTDIVAPSVPTGNVDNIIFFAVMALFGVLTLGMTALAAYLTKLLGNSVKTEQLEGLLMSGQKWAYQQAMTTAARTPEEWDDNLIKTIAAVLKYDPSLSAQIPTRPIPRPTLPPPDVPVVPTESDDSNVVIGFTDVFGVIGKKETWKQSGHPDAVIEIPAGYNHTPVYIDGNGKVYPAKAIETNEKYGTRLNIAHIGSIHKFTRQSRPVAAKGKNIITLEYDGNVNDATGRDPHYNWLWMNCYVNGKAVVSAQREGDTAHHIATKNGIQQAAWFYESDKTEPVEVAFEIVIHWGIAGDMSYIDLKRASLKKA